MDIEQFLKEADYRTEFESSQELAFINIPDIIVPEGKKPLMQRKMRCRVLTCSPGGVIGLHSHENRPAILYVLQGRGEERSTAFDGIKQWEEGDCFAEYNNLQHWVKNLSDIEELKILTFDLLDDGTPCRGC
jgi:quercetin dioxygenase-like cupin family protein